jgi:hypothetical protein
MNETPRSNEAASMLLTFLTLLKKRVPAIATTLFLDSVT